MNAGDVIDGMLRCVAGQIVACNVVSGVDNGLINRHLAKDAFEWLARLATFEPRYRSPGTLVKALRMLRGGDHPAGMSVPTPPPEFRLRGEAGIEDRDLSGSTSCILPAGLLNRLISPLDRQRLRREGLVFPSSGEGFLSYASIDRWRRKPAAARRVRFDPNATLGRPRSVVWFTRRRNLSAALGRRDRRDHAQRARDLLGLVHHQRGTVLAALHFPAGILAASHSARPTFADAADHPRFRAWPEGRRARSDPYWGRTADLRALDRGERFADGCPERVTREIAGSDLPKDGWFEFDLLGVVDVALGANLAADRAYAARLLGGMSVATLGARLRSFL